MEIACFWKRLNAKIISRLLLIFILLIIFSCQRTDKDKEDEKIEIEIKNKKSHESYIRCNDSLEMLKKDIYEKYCIPYSNFVWNSKFEIYGQELENLFYIPEKLFENRKNKETEKYIKNYNEGKTIENRIDTSNFKEHYVLDINLNTNDAIFWHYIPELIVSSDSNTIFSLIYPKKATNILPENIEITTYNGKEIGNSGQSPTITLLIKTNETAFSCYKVVINNINFSCAIPNNYSNFSYSRYKRDLSIHVCLNGPEKIDLRCYEHTYQPDGWFDALLRCRGLGFLIIFNFLFILYSYLSLSPSNLILRKFGYSFTVFMNENNGYGVIVMILCNLFIFFNNTKPFIYISSYFDSFKPFLLSVLLASLIPILLNELFFIISFIIYKYRK